MLTATACVRTQSTRSKLACRVEDAIGSMATCRRSRPRALTNTLVVSAKTMREEVSSHAPSSAPPSSSCWPFARIVFANRENTAIERVPGAPEHDLQLGEPEDEVVALVDENDSDVGSEFFRQPRRQLQTTEPCTQHHDTHGPHANRPSRGGTHRDSRAAVRTHNARSRLPRSRRSADRARLAALTW